MSNKIIATQIYNDALEASLPKNFMHEYCKLEGDILSIGQDKYDLNAYENLYIFGSGKAAFTMAYEMEVILASKISGGVIVCPFTNEKLQYIDVREGSHPIPTQKSINSATELLESMKSCSEKDLFIYLLSGGSSALIEIPEETISLEDIQTTTDVMLRSGLEITQMNSVRKHLSQIKGGRLIESCKASGAVLVISDIIGNDLYSIGSAPTYADKSTYGEAKKILEEKEIFSTLPPAVQDVFNRGSVGLLRETPKTPKPNIKHYVIASNQHAIAAASKSARLLVLDVKEITEPMSGDVEVMVDYMKSILKHSPQECIIFGGECTVNVTGSGEGGRNQHAALLMLKSICLDGKEICFLSAGTDGIDGNSNAAGAVVDKKSCKKAQELGLNIDTYLKSFDSHNFFRQTDDLVITGVSGTNVIDIAIILQTDKFKG